MTALLRGIQFRLVPDLWIDFTEIREGYSLRKALETHKECDFEVSIQRSSAFEEKFKQIACEVQGAPPRNFGIAQVDSRNQQADVLIGLADQKMEDLLTAISAFGAHRCQIEASLEVSGLASTLSGGRSYLITEEANLLVQFDGPEE